MVLNTTFHNISVISVSFIGGENRSARRKPPTCRKSLTNFITCTPRLSGIKCTEMALLCTHNKTYRISPVGFMSIAFFLEQTDVLKQTHIVITDNQVAEALLY